jgi:hypothetical protein
MGKLGQLLVARGWITVQQLTRALQTQNSVGGRLGTCLLEMEVLGEELLGRALSEQLGVPAAGIEELRAIPDEVLQLIPERLARRCRAIPFRVTSGRLDVAMQDPRNLVCQDEIAFACGRRVKVHVLHELRVHEAMQRYYREECPSRYTLLLDRLNRARYLWGARQEGAAAAEERTEVLSTLTSEGLLASAPPMPPPQSEPGVQLPPRRRSLFRSRSAAGAQSPAARSGAERQLPPLEELDLRPEMHRQGAQQQAVRPGARQEVQPGAQQSARPAAATSPAPGGATGLAGPAASRPTAGSGREAAQAASAPARPGAVAPGVATPAAVARPATAGSSAAAPGVPGTGPLRAPDLEATLTLGPPALTRPPAAAARLRPAMPPPAKIALTEAERAELGIEEAPPGEAAEPAPAVPAAPAAPLRAAPATLAEVEQAFAATTDREEVGRILLGYLARSFRRAALFQVSRTGVTAWMAQGDGIDQEAFGRYAVDFKQPSVFLNLRQGSGIHMGPLPPMATHRELALCWGGGLPRDCVMLPVWLRDRLVTVIYADGASRGLGGIDLEQMHRLVAATQAAFGRYLLRKKRGNAQS